MNCIYWQDVGMAFGGKCTLGLYGGQPGASVCLRCAQKVEGEPLPAAIPECVRLMNERNAQRAKEKKTPSVALLKKAKHLAKAGLKWAKAGFPITDAETRRANHATCRGCELWNPAGNLGLGECSHSSCGCSALKASFGTETCPLGKWLPISATSSSSALSSEPAGPVA